MLSPHWGKGSEKVIVKGEKLRYLLGRLFKFIPQGYLNFSLFTIHYSLIFD